MKILYAFPSTGYGHISRAKAVYPYLLKFGSVDLLVSGFGKNIQFPFPIKYNCYGLGLHYNHNGGLDIKRIFKDVQYSTFRKRASQLELKDYDLVISDFEPISASAARNSNIQFLHWGHQASFAYSEVPRAKSFMNPGKWLLENLVISEWNYGIHFKSFNSSISVPIIKDEVYNAERVSDDIVTIYLPHYNIKKIIDIIQPIKGIKFQIFHPEIENYYEINNLQFFPINSSRFNQSLIQCKLIITGGGFETPSEAMYLNKRIISIPIKNHYEQKCNAIVLDSMGIVVINDLSLLTTDLILKEFNTFGFAEYNFKVISPQQACHNLMAYWEENSSSLIAQGNQLLPYNY